MIEKSGDLSSFKNLLSLVNEYLEGFTKLTSDEIKERIQKSYEEEETIDSSQYDYLMGLILE